MPGLTLQDGLPARTRQADGHGQSFRHDANRLPPNGLTPGLTVVCRAGADWSCVDGAGGMRLVSRR